MLNLNNMKTSATCRRKKGVGVSLDDELRDQLDAQAAEEHTTRSEVIRRAVLRYLAENPQPAACSARPCAAPTRRAKAC